jgi:LmbE family N-acetylglucosaminyl deacetylase
MTALLLAPHNDDETLFAAFSCLRFRPHVIVCLRSFRMADPSYPGGMPVNYKTREFETEMAMKALGCSWTQLERPDEPYVVDWTGFKDEILSISPDPAIVFAPADEEHGHDQHNGVARLADYIFGNRVRHYYTYTTAGKTRAGVEVEYEPEWVALKHHALACYKSQSAHPATRAHFMADLEEYVAA